MRRTIVLLAVLAAVFVWREASGQAIGGVRVNYSRYPMVVSDVGDLNVSGAVSGLRAGQSYSIVWQDADGRIMERLSGVAGAGEQPFRLNVSEARTVYNQVLCYIGGAAVAFAPFYVPLVEQKWEDFLVAASIGPGKISSDVGSVLRSAGVRAVVLSRDQPPGPFLSANMKIVAKIVPPVEPLVVSRDVYSPVVASYLKDWDAKYLRRPVPIGGSHAENLASESIRSAVGYWGMFAPVGFVLGDDVGAAPPNRVFDFDFSPVVISAWQAELQRRYGNIQNLDRRWSVKATRWENLEPDTSAAAIRRNRNLSPGEPMDFASWLTFRETVDGAFCDLMRFCVRTGHDLDKPIQLGVTGPLDMVGFSGAPLPVFLRIPDFACVGPSRVERMLASAASAGTKLLADLDADAEGSGRQLWEAALDRCAGAMLRGPGGLASPKTPAGGTTAKFVDANSELIGGIGVLLRNAAKVRPQVAVYYSRRSQLVSFMLDAVARHEIFPERMEKGVTEDITYNAVLGAWGALLDDLGVTFDLMTESDFESREFQNSPYRVIVLPRTLVLSEREIARLESFVSGGGVVVADGGGACFSQEGIASTSAQALFGYRRDAMDLNEVGAKVRRATGQAVENRAVAAAVPDYLRGVNLKHLALAETGLKLVGSSSMLTMDGIPALIVRSARRGRVITLNLSALSYVDGPYKFSNNGVGRVVRNILDDVSLSRPCAVFYGGGPLIGVRVWSYSYGPQARIIALMRTRPAEAAASAPATRKVPSTVKTMGAMETAASDERTVEILLPEAMFCYDVRAGKFLGQTDRISAQLSADSPVVLSLLPYKVQGLEGRKTRRGPLWSFDARVITEPGQPAPGHHVFTAALLRNNRIILPEKYAYSQDGHAIGDIYLGQELPAERYLLRIRDVLTGTVAETEEVITSARLRE